MYMRILRFLHEFKNYIFLVTVNDYDHLFENKGCLLTLVFFL